MPYAQYYEYNPQLAREILAELGFRDTDGNGILNWPEDHALAGQDLIIEVLSSEVQAAVQAGQILVPMLREIGIDLRLRVLVGGALSSRLNSGDFDMLVQRVTQPVPDVNPALFGPVTLDAPVWHQAGPGGRELLPFEAQMEALMQEAQFTTDAARRTEIFREILQLHVENIYTIGLYESRRGLAIHNRLRNIPADLPVHFYEWGLEHMPWVAWTPEEEQIAPRFLNLIPTEEAYQNRAWNR